MRVNTVLGKDQIGKFLLMSATPNLSLVVKVVSIFDDLVGLAVVDPTVATRSAKVRFKKDVIYSFYDTEQEANEELEKMKSQIDKEKRK